MTGTTNKARPTRVDEAEAMLRSLIAERRSNGETRLPPEQELSEQLGIARSTLRAALTRLQLEGEIARQRKVGTVITSPGARKAGRSALAYPVDMILSLSDYLQAVGVEYAVQAVSVRRDQADAKIASALGLGDRDLVFTVSRLYEVEGAPAASLRHILPVVLNGNDVRIESLTEGITTFLQDSEHIDLTHTQSTITAEAASPELARELEIEERDPLLVMRAELFADGPAPVALGRLVFRPDVLSLTASADDGASTGDSTSGLRLVRARSANQKEDE